MTTPINRKLSAILSADVKDYSRLIVQDEAETVERIRAYRELIDTRVREHKGRVVDTPGDNILAEFPNAIDAVRCAVEIQGALKNRNADLPANQRMEFRIGINLGDTVTKDDSIFGEGVNIAARVESLADPRGIFITDSVYNQVKSRDLSVRYEYIGEREAKNVDEPLRLYRVLWGMGADTVDAERKLGERRRNALIAAGIVATVVIVIVSAIFYHQLPLSEGPKSVDKPSIAVLPFDNMSGDPDQEYFADSITEEIISRLSLNSMLTVISRNSTFTYKGKPVKVQQVSKELDVKHVLEGSIRREGNRIRVTAQLIDANTGAHLWTKTYDQELKSRFAVQDDIAQQIAASLRVEYTEAELERVKHIETKNVTASVSLWRGVSFYRRLTREANAQAQEYFKNAIELDPQYALAYSWLGHSYFIDVWMGWASDPTQLLDRALQLGYQANALDDSCSLSHMLLAEVYNRKGQNQEAMAHAEMALSLDPNDSQAYVVMAECLGYAGKGLESIEMREKALRLNPKLDAQNIAILAANYRNVGQYEKSVLHFKRAFALNPDFEASYFGLANTYVWQWITQQADDPTVFDWALKAAEKCPTPWIRHFIKSIAYISKGQHSKAITEAEKLGATAFGYGFLAEFHLYEGKPEEAIKLAEKGRRIGLPYSAVWYYRTVGDAYSVLNRQTEAVGALRSILNHNPSHGESFVAHLGLALNYAELGRLEEARIEAAKVLTLVPNFSVDIWGERVPYKKPALVQRYMAALRKAGLE